MSADHDTQDFLSSVRQISGLFDRQGVALFFRYITANDVGTTGGHQYGFYIPKSGWRFLFDTPGVKGSNKERSVDVIWDFGTTTNCCFKYYGKNTRNEYRITRFGRDFPYLREEYTGSLLVMVKVESELYHGFVLSGDEEIDLFYETFDLSPTGSSCLVEKSENDSNRPLYTEDSFMSLFFKYNKDFPSSKEMAFWAEKLELLVNSCTRQVTRNKPDETLLKWIDNEYMLFRALEERVYKPIYSKPFSSANELIAFANQILNRRKSRAGKSLEHHLARIFKCCEIRFNAQAFTEGKRRPDFIFPSQADYHNPTFPVQKLVFLAAKTTCKDRWRQILAESERISTKYLFTLQQGISKNQLLEMTQENVVLVVPKHNINYFDKSYRDNILSLTTFLQIVEETQLD